ncbi:uncharacterized protein LOC143277409 isoform X4 [Babylonia areolata]|uniref:uncharacterized protein LOC143277409 isoform X4 n=1 Tax=Babylonia areolata TaxID=304850 RepID=UPI003FD1B0B5
MQQVGVFHQFQSVVKREGEVDNRCDCCTSVNLSSSPLTPWDVKSYFQYERSEVNFDFQTECMGPNIKHVVKTEPVTANTSNDVIKTEPVTANTSCDVIKTEPVTANTSSDVIKTEAVTTNTSNDVIKTEPVTANISNDVIKTEPVTANTSNDVIKTEPVTANTSCDVIKTEPVTGNTSCDVIKTEPVTANTSCDVIKTEPVTGNTSCDVINTEPVTGNTSNVVIKIEPVTGNTSCDVIKTEPITANTSSDVQTKAVTDIMMAMTPDAVSSASTSSRDEGDNRPARDYQKDGKLQSSVTTQAAPQPWGSASEITVQHMSANTMCSSNMDMRRNVSGPDDRKVVHRKSNKAGDNADKEGWLLLRLVT